MLIRVHELQGLILRGMQLISNFTNRKLPDGQWTVKKGRPKLGHTFLLLFKNLDTGLQFQ